MKSILNIKFLCFCLFVANTLVSCNKSYTVPTSATATQQDVVLYPDYTNVTIPANIAPLNFIVKNEGQEFVAQVMVNGKEVLVAGGDEDGIVQFDSTEWKSVLSQNRGKSLQVTIYANQDGNWVSYKPYSINIAEEDIDPYLSYRLIEPGFELYRQVGLYQRNLTTFDQNVIYENNRDDIADENHCVNCHNYQNYGGKKMLFHVRANMGGTIIAKDGKVEKLNFKNDSILGSAVYPSWHPEKNYIVFSTNRTGQAFHIKDIQKIEVLDYGSDLLFYNADTHEVSNIIKSEGAMETFPTWSPDGKKIYFCQAQAPAMASLPDSMKINYVLTNYQNIYYNVMSVTFDPVTMSFGEPEVEVDCASMKKSATVPRISPDGKFLLFTLGDFGQFHIWHSSSDQWMKNLETGEIYPLTEANSNDVDSYHSWSSNGRWIVFSSRRNDGSYTRPYIAYVDKSGKPRKAFMLPQEDPTQNLMLLKSYNVPELTREPIAYDADQFKDAIYNQEGTVIKYKELRSLEIIANQKAQDAKDRQVVYDPQNSSNSSDNTSANISQNAGKSVDESQKENADTNSKQKASDAVSGATSQAKRADGVSGATTQAKKTLD